MQREAGKPAGTCLILTENAADYQAFRGLGPYRNCRRRSTSAARFQARLRGCEKPPIAGLTDARMTTARTAQFHAAQSHLDAQFTSRTCVHNCGEQRIWIRARAGANSAIIRSDCTILTQYASSVTCVD
jgi:hypothetical protein